MSIAAPELHEVDTPDAPAVCRVAIVIPAFNESGGVVKTIAELRSALSELDGQYEIVLVDDGSTDDTAARAETTGVRVIRQPRNLGYGAALKAGIAATQSELVAITDADGTYPAEAIPGLVAAAADADMVVGARSAWSAGIPLVRRPAKWFLTRLASYLAGQRIPDLNSGLRVLRRTTLEPFIPILPMGFSFTTTITLAMLCTQHRVIYQPIEYRRRIGKSKIRPVDFINFMMLVLRTVVLFNPLKVFVPLGLGLLVLGMAKFVYDLFLWNLSESAVMAMLAALVIWSLGLLADMIARLQLWPRGSR